MSKVNLTTEFASDWFNDQAMTLCSPATRGVWVDVICRMALADVSGQQSHSVDEWARLCRTSHGDMSAAITDLKARCPDRVHERDGIVTLIWPEMRRSFLGRKSARERKQRERDGGCHANVTPVSRKRHKVSSPSPRSPLPLQGGTPLKAPGVVVDADVTPKSSHPVAALALPAGLDTPRFRAAWADWIEYRRQRRKPLTARAIELQIAKCGQWGEEGAVASIELSISSGWQGLFPPRKGAATATRPNEDDGTWKPQNLKPGTLAELMQDGGDE